MSEGVNELGRVGDTIGQWFTELFADLGAFSSTCEMALRGVRGEKEPLTEKHLRAIHPVATTFLEHHPLIEAAGIALGPGVVNDTARAIEWFARGTRIGTERIRFTLDPTEAGFYDYLTHEWFAGVMKSGAPTLHGPYLDYAGLDKHIVASTVPLFLDGVLIGAAGCDTEVHALESVVMPPLRQIPMDAALVSELDRIIVGNSGRFQVGNRIGELPRDLVRTPLPGVDLGLHLVAHP